MLEHVEFTQMRVSPLWQWSTYNIDTSGWIHSCHGAVILISTYKLLEKKRGSRTLSIARRHFPCPNLIAILLQQLQAIRGKTITGYSAGWMCFPSAGCCFQFQRSVLHSPNSLQWLLASTDYLWLQISASVKLIHDDFHLCWFCQMGCFSAISSCSCFHHT